MFVSFIFPFIHIIQCHIKDTAYDFDLYTSTWVHLNNLKFTKKKLLNDT